MSDLGFPSRRHPFFQAMQKGSVEWSGLDEADFERVIPRHFPLSIPGDICPDIPVETPTSVTAPSTPLVDSAD